MQWCACCGDLCLITRPIEVKYWDGVTVTKNICLDCFNEEDSELVIKLNRTHTIGSILGKLNKLDEQ